MNPVLSKLELTQKLNTMLTTRGVTVSANEVEIELDNALLEYYNDRHFTPTDEMLYEPIYEGIILQLAISSILKIGAEGEKYHSEGGVIRTYDSGNNYPTTLTSRIIPLAKGL